MKTVFFSFFLFLSFISTGYSQVKIIQGIVKSEKDSLPVDSVLVVLRDFVSTSDYNDGFVVKNTLYYTLTDSTGKFEFRNVIIPGLRFLDSTSETMNLHIEILRNAYVEQADYIELDTNSITNLEYYLTPYGPYVEDTTPVSPPSPPKPYREYTNAAFFAGTQFDPDGSYQFNYKAGVAVQTNFKFSPVNYLGLDFNPIIYRRYNVSHDSVNTTAVYAKEYFSSLQSGFGIYIRTHVFSWSKKKNALFIDVGAEYDFPWYYRYVNKPDKDSKFSFNHFHKYNELYANARIGIVKWVYLKGQYRLTDLFKEPYVELSRWSAELQVVFMLSGF